MESSSPLVSVGVPTYNRPTGLTRTLNAIISQTYTNLEIIVSDNCSDNTEVSSVIDEFCKRDTRIVSVRQTENIGASNNFKFALNKASGAYFIWAADDDEWLGTDFIEKLMKHAAENVLTFSAAVFSRGDGDFDYPLKAYDACQKKFDYLKTFCSNGLGHPFYGLYNLTLFKQHQLKFQFDEDLSYYNEGTFLHKIFLTGSVKYVKDAKVLFSVDSIKPTYDLRISNFVEYFKRTLQIYANTNDISAEQKSVLINEILNLYTPHLKHLFENFALSEKDGLNLSYRISEHPQNSSLVDKIRRRIVLTAKVFVKGYY